MGTYNIIGQRNLRKYTAASKSPVYASNVEAQKIVDSLCGIKWEPVAEADARMSYHTDDKIGEGDDAKSGFDTNVDIRNEFDAAKFCAEHESGQHRAYANAAVYKYKMPDAAIGKTITSLKVNVTTDPYNPDGVHIHVFTNDTGEIPMSCHEIRGEDDSGEVIDDGTTLSGFAPRTTKTIDDEEFWYPTNAVGTMTPESGLEIGKYLFVSVVMESYSSVRGNWIEGCSFIENLVSITTGSDISGWTDGEEYDLRGVEYSIDRHLSPIGPGNGMFKMLSIGSTNPYVIGSAIPGPVSDVGAVIAVVGDNSSTGIYAFTGSSNVEIQTNPNAIGAVYFKGWFFASKKYDDDNYGIVRSKDLVNWEEEITFPAKISSAYTLSVPFGKVLIAAASNMFWYSSDGESFAPSNFLVGGGYATYDSTNVVMSGERLWYVFTPQGSTDQDSFPLDEYMNSLQYSEPGECFVNGHRIKAGSDGIYVDGAKVSSLVGSFVPGVKPSDAFGYAAYSKYLDSTTLGIKECGSHVLLKTSSATYESSGDFTQWNQLSFSGARSFCVKDGRTFVVSMASTQTPGNLYYSDDFETWSSISFVFNSGEAMVPMFTSTDIVIRTGDTTHKISRDNGDTWITIDASAIAPTVNSEIFRGAYNGTLIFSVNGTMAYLSKDNRLLPLFDKNGSAIEDFRFSIIRFSDGRTAISVDRGISGSGYWFSSFHTIEMDS